VLIPAERTSANDGVAQSRDRFAPWDAPEGPGSSVEGQSVRETPIVRRGHRHLCKANTYLGVTSRLGTVGGNQ
jgi:hypothetical protein